MHPLSLCPKKFDSAKDCKAMFCSYRNKKGKCSLDFEPEDKEYSVGEIAEALQTSRQRVWRLYDVAIAKLRKGLSQD